jgi:hypothetical protein
MLRIQNPTCSLQVALHRYLSFPAGYFAQVMLVCPSFVTKFLIRQLFSGLVAMVPVTFGHPISLNIILCPRVEAFVVNIIILVTFNPMPFEF